MLNGTDLEEIFGGKVDVVFVWDERSNVGGGGDGGMSEGEEGEKGSNKEEFE